MSLGTQKSGFGLRTLGRLEGAREVTEARCYCSRYAEAQRSSGPHASLHGQEAGRSLLVPESLPPPCLPLQPCLQVSWKPCLGPVKPQGGPAAGRGAAFWGPQAPPCRPAWPTAHPPPWLQDGPGWENASGAAQRAPGMLIHSSQELPVK